jgi:hypothetical protein
MSFIPSQRSFLFEPIFHPEGEYQFDPGRSLKDDKAAWNTAAQQAIPLHKIRATKRDFSLEESWLTKKKISEMEVIRRMQFDVTVQD